MLRRWLAPWVLASVAALGLAQEAHAGGFEVPDMGARALGRGAANVVGAQDGTAIHYNPGSLAKMRGTTVLYNHGLMWQHTQYSRAALSEAWGDDAGTTFDPVSPENNLFPYLATLVVTSDFGLDNWTFAAGVYGPNGFGKQSYPSYGPQAFMLTELDVLLAYYTLGAAWKWKDVFGIGAVVQYADLMRLDYGVLSDSVVTTGLSPVSDPASTQLVTNIELKDRTAATAQIGAWYRPHQRFELGFSSRFVPVYFNPKGGVSVDKETLVTEEIKVEMDLTLPIVVRGGLRYIHDTGTREWFDIELDAVYESWSMLKSFDLNVQGQLNGQELQELNIAKSWKDTVSVRLGGDVHPLPPYLTLRTGAFFETAAAPKNFSNLDFPSFQRFGVGGGFTAGAKGAYLTVGYMHVFQEDRTVSEEFGKVFGQRPLRPCPSGCDGLSGVPGNAGKFKTGYDLLTVGIDLRFQELLADRRAKRSKPKPQPAAASQRAKHGA
ncbi:MAG: outer membrane protein transport protein [Nannocystaceae bacterium]|nr:outer membrane protein transport protein [Nannocystaceae bacterium]